MRVVTHELTGLANTAELEYREHAQLEEDEFATVDGWIDRLERDACFAQLPWVMARGFVPTGEGVDLGAGTGWLAGQLSALPSVTHVHAVEFSTTQLTGIGPAIVRHVGGDQSKITLHVGDMHDLSMFDAGALDFVCVAAALHHAVDLDRVLREVRRILRPGGLLVGFNEPGVPRFVTPLVREQASEHFGAYEREHGVTEKTYTQEEWAAHFNRAGFDVRFLPCFLRRGNWRAEIVRRRPASWLNGPLFWSKTIIAHAR